MAMGGVLQHLLISIHALREEGDHRMNGYWPNAFDFYPRPPRGGRRFQLSHEFGALLISIHALREEGDRVPEPGDPGRIHFYPRPPRGGRRGRGNQLHRTEQHFYPRPPRGGRRDLWRYFVHIDVFLSTPSARRATCPQTASPPQPFDFYPRPPRGGRQSVKDARAQLTKISIHALREEGDLKVRGKKLTRKQFLSTPSARRATRVWHIS